MDFLEKIVETVSEKGTEAVQKAREATDVIQLKSELRERKHCVEKQYLEMGILYFEKHKDDEEPEFEQMGSIKRIQKECKEIRDDIAALKGKNICFNCGQYMEKNGKFCSNCGSSQEV